MAGFVCADCGGAMPDERLAVCDLCAGAAVAATGVGALDGACDGDRCACCAGERETATRRQRRRGEQRPGDRSRELLRQMQAGQVQAGQVLIPGPDNAQ